MPSAGLEPVIPAVKPPQTYSLQRVATGIGGLHIRKAQNVKGTCKGEFRLGTGYENRGRVEIWFYSFFNLGAGLEWMVNATPRLLYPREADPVPIV